MQISEEQIRRALGFYAPGLTPQQIRSAVGAQQFDQAISQTKPFNPDEFLDEITRKRPHMVNAVNLDRLKATDRAFHFAFDPDRRVRSDYEAMLFPQDFLKKERDDPIDDAPNQPAQTMQKQYCENPACTGTENKWIRCSSKKNCWYHFSCAGISANKTQEEIEQMDWYCPKCRKGKGNKRR